MKTIDNGCYVTVKVSAREVEEFRHRFPCSGVPERALWFQFHKRTGDLVDMSPCLHDCDGAGLLALSQDAWEGRSIK